MQNGYASALGVRCGAAVVRAQLGGHRGGAVAHAPAPARRARHHGRRRVPVLRRLPCARPAAGRLRAGQSTLLPPSPSAAVAGPSAPAATRCPAPSQRAGADEPGFVPGPFNRLFVCIFLFEVAFGLSITFGAGPTAWWQRNVRRRALALAHGARARSARRARTRCSTCRGCSWCSGSSSRPRRPPCSGRWPSARSPWARRCSASSPGRRSPSSRRATPGRHRGPRPGLLRLEPRRHDGVVLGHLPVAASAAGADVRLLLFALVAAAFVGYVWIGLKDFSFSAAIRGVKPVESGGSRRSEAAIDTRAHLASVHGLTEREGEVFALLARGRNGAFIQEECRVTRNTAKTHIRHIYQKLGVHTQQELIDLVESGRDFIV
ncbi:MAG: response regulator transcription factor [Eggerthellaceae bacterium]